MNDWLTLVLQMKKKYSCSLKDAMAHAKKIYKKK